jgi:glycine C-acetyltransferase
MRDSKAWLVEEYKSIVEKGFDWKLRRLNGPSTPVCNIEGKEVIMLCSNNYLNLSNHPKLKRAAIAGVKSNGAGSGSVRAIAGNMDLHEDVEAIIPKFKGVEAALCFQTGFAANAGVIPQLMGDGDLIISDELNHGSIIDGVRLLAMRQPLVTTPVAAYPRRMPSVALQCRIP